MKFEIGEAAQLRIIRCQVPASHARQAESLLASGNARDVAGYADQFLLRDILGLSEATVSALRVGADILAKRRKSR